jgi:hypothetical protein
MKEIKIINDVLGGKDAYDRMFQNGFQKHQKHGRYINRRGFGGEIIPRYFYFAVPPELVETAKEELKAKDYGIMSVSKRVTPDDYILIETKVERRAKPLHNERIDLKEHGPAFLTKLSFMNNNMLRKAYLK